VSSPAAESAAVNAAGATRRRGELFGHPTCLFTLFFTEMWERFSFYGMKALLILYMVNYLFWRQDDASQVMAWYAGLVYATPVFGGIIADKLIGARWSVVIGGVLIAIGHFCLAFEPLPFFYSGLGFLIAGVGFLKPNISTQVGALYRSRDERRDSAFTVFYMGINTGAFLGPIICEYLRLSYGWHYGFAAAGVGMVIGLIVYIAGMGSVVRREKQIAAEEAAERDEKEKSATPAQPVGATGEPAIEKPVPEAEAALEYAAVQRTGIKGFFARIPVIGPVFFQNPIYRDRSIVVLVICVFAILFWVGFEQAANVMNLWADKHTNMHVFRGAAPMVEVSGVEPTLEAASGTGAARGIRDWEMGPAMTQSINPLFIIIFAGIFAWFWQFLERRNRQPSTPVKMMLGVFFLSCAYGIMLMAAQRENQYTSAELSSLPTALQVDDQGRVYNTVVEDGEEKHVYYGATRLRWENGTLHMNGVLTDLDWMRALGATASEAYGETVKKLARQAEDRAEEVRQAKQAGTLARDYQWKVETTVPPEAGEIRFVAGLPEHKVAREEEQVAFWDAQTRSLMVTAILSDKDKAQLLAAGADPQFRDALTEIYKESSVLRVSIAWLLAFYLVLTIGELCLSPVGLSLVTKAAPPAYVGLFMGFWFFTTGAVSNFLAHYAGGHWGTMTPAHYFMIFGVIGLVATVIMLFLLRVLKPLLHGVH
jgi:POT family proton-dependent oligopeptide transporter